MTVHQRVAAARHRLQDAGIGRDVAGLDARLLAQRALDWDAARLLTYGDEPEPEGFPQTFDALVARRAAREPMAHISGRQEFWGLAFEVSPAVLVPRPETELIVEAALAAFPDAKAPLDIAEIGTGSGCIAVALAHERPASHLVATDVSPEALDVARRNAASHAVDRRIEIVKTDLLNEIDGPFDLVVSNPPYVPEPDRATLPPEVRDHEPAIALFGGRDGLDVVRRLAEQAAPRLKPKGYLIFEFGFGQADAVKEIVSRVAGLTLLEVQNDLQGIPRVAIIQRS